MDGGDRALPPHHDGVRRRGDERAKEQPQPGGLLLPHPAALVDALDVRCRGRAAHPLPRLLRLSHYRPHPQDRRHAHGDHRLAHGTRIRIRRVRLRADDVARGGRRNRQLEARRLGAREARARGRGEVMGAGTFKLLFLGLMGSGIPVAIAMAGSSLIYVMISGVSPDYVIVHRMFGGLDSFPLLAVPFFILAGNLMNCAGITNRIYNFALALVGWMKGGLGHVNVVGSVIFAAMSGTAIADAAGLGTIEIKAMQDHGYSTEFSVGVTAASATLGPIIPPSLPFVIYGMMANVSIGALFMGGFIPGAVMTIFMMLYVTYCARKYNMGRDQVFRWGILGATFVAALPPLLTPAIIMGGMTFGWFTPTEAAIAACAWAMILGVFLYRSLSFKQFYKVTLDTVETTAGVLLIVGAASLFGWVLTTTRITE